MSVLRSSLNERFQFDVLVREPEPGALEPEVRELGSRIIRCPRRRNPLAYLTQLRKILREYGPYDVVHSHLHLFDGLVLAAAAVAGVPLRISHSHNARDSRRPTPLRVLQRLLLGAALGVSATHRVGVSEASYWAQFGARCAHSGRSKILRNGIEVSSLQNAPEVRAAVRRELGIPEDAKLIGHVGRFDEHKNHAFLLSCFDELCRRDDGWQMVLVGDGPLRRRVMDRSEELNLRSLIADLGVRADVHRILQAMDVFLFPSLYEGFGIALLEAQAHGLPCVASTKVPADADAGLGLVTYMDLSAGPTAWAAEASRRVGPARSYADCRAALRRAGYDMRDIVKEWASLYQPDATQEA